MTATQDSFTKELFMSLNLEWDEHAEARDVLTKIIFEEETLDTLFEDVIYTLDSFFQFVKKEDVDPYYEKVTTLCSVVYELKIKLDVKSEKTVTTIFRISLEEDGEFIFLDNVGSKCRITNLEELQIFMIHWFGHFYKRYVI
jgi:hypothetical protein